MKRALLPLLLVAAVTIAGGIALTCGIEGSKPPGYDITVSFNTGVTQPDIDETQAILRSYDSSVSFLLQESFPPTGRAALRTKVAGFCATVVRQLEAVHGVGKATCQPARTPEPGTPDTPVSSTPD